MQMVYLDIREKTQIPKNPESQKIQKIQKMDLDEPFEP